MSARAPAAAPAVVKTLAVTFVTVFAPARRRLRRRHASASRDQVRQSVTTNLESSQRMFAALETRRQHELLAQAATLAENPTLKAALDTYQAEARTSSEAVQSQLLATIDGELGKVAAARRVGRDRAGRRAPEHARRRGPAGRVAGRAGGRSRLPEPGTATASTASRAWAAATFRVVAVPLQFGDGTTIGTLYLATSLDAAYAEELAPAGGHADGDRQRRSAGGQHAAAAARARIRSGGGGDAGRSTARSTLDGESYAFRRLVAVGDTVVLRARLDRRVVARRHAPGDVEPRRSSRIGAIGARAARQRHARAAADRSDRPAVDVARARWPRRTTSTLAAAADRIEPRARRAHRDVQRADGVGGAAEAETEAAYTGAIRALATALDARDPYTAGHSERVSVLSVAIGRTLSLSADDLEVLRLGALLHDIGKIGVPDDVLRKPGALTAAEFDVDQAASGARRAHPAVGAVSRAAHSDRRAAPRAARRPRLSERAARRRHSARRAHRPRRRRLRRDDERPRLPRRAPVRRRAARAVALRRHRVRRGDRRRAGDRAAGRHVRRPAMWCCTVSENDDERTPIAASPRAAFLRCLSW